MSVKIIHEPSVYMVGKSSVLDIQLNQFLDDHGVGDWNTDSRNTTKLVEVAGRLCYMSFANPRPGGNKAYIEHILEVGHGSVLEHAVYSLIITGVSRSLTHELIRHRAGMSYSQLSQRYVDESDVAFVLPPIMSRATKEWIYARSVNLAEYRSLVQEIEQVSNETDKTARRKQAREAARSVLPNCTETKIFVTGNARAWRHFLELRGSIHADAEIQRLAKAVLSVLQEASPNIFGDYTITGG
ncbi:THY1 Predicted alternative thymidylate synthase, partial [uncultured Caudovirales phage]